MSARIRLIHFERANWYHRCYDDLQDNETLEIHRAAFVAA